VPSISAANKTIARIVSEVFGGIPKVVRYWDGDHKSHVDILTCEDRPQNGVISYSTVGLSDWPLYRGEEEYGVRLEIVGACGSTFTSFDNALSTAAFCIINSKWFCFPGAVFPDVLSMYDCSPTMQHFMFVPPFLWENDLKTIDLEEKKVTWLLAIPISEAERAFANDNGSEKLEDLFVERQIDVFNLCRPSEI
jgi:hypothetical protein